MDKDEDKWDFVPYNESIALQGLGFNKKCFAKIDQINCLQIKGKPSGPRGSMVYDYVDSPLYSQAFRWFRKEHKIHSTIDQYENPKSWGYGIDYEDYIQKFGFKTYEEAELACLQKLIKIVEIQKAIEIINNK
jgi:hypothetical protein